MMFYPLLGVLSAANLGLAAIWSRSASLPTATIDSGPIIGTTTSFPSSTRTVKKFLGIPFAKKPVRFTPSVAVDGWSKPYNATTWGVACNQEISQAAELFYEAIHLGNPLGGEGEDCLNLNVFTPKSASRGSLAVLVWFYGGGNANGATSLHQYDGSYFSAMQNVVVVSVNYRTNVFGFPGGDVPLEHRNLGLLDQRLALRWIQRNIATLGGDPDKVTIFGESSGAASVDALLTSPPDPMLFRAAIMQSGQSSVKLDNAPDDIGYSESWKQLLSATNCTSNPIRCLRSIPAAKLEDIATKNNYSGGPVADNGQTWATSPRYERIISKEGNSSIARVPILIGNNADEDKPFIIGMNDTLSALFEAGLGAYAPIILAAYPIGASGVHTENDRISLIVNDFEMNCPIGTFANDSTRVGIPTWRYFFNASFPNNELFRGSGAYHSAEIPLIFGTYQRENVTFFEKEVSQAMQKAWGDFAKDPYCGPGWDTVPTVGVFGDGVKAGMSAIEKKALRNASAGEIDSRCHLYKSIYAKTLHDTY
ncbi:carboxylesterase hlo [Penicillium angulare]|uniref:carboxylesterase hlo n=1 Tax=Penicillium angulare TaxID=116970 RepID=UPI002542174C|nr:carboxylesterase hlo [Penicillium angulare]KAJ5289090.1 carboxylesterase hlo [Penicillium angulare]